MNGKGTVFNIQRFSLDDGPGIRTTVFLKGCNLQCKWCHNPESIKKGYQLMYLPDNCFGCGRCAEQCSYSAHTFCGNIHEYDSKLCIGCMECVAVCATGALQISGEEKSADDIMKIVLRDKVYYSESGGGVTFSGGEPMLQPEFLEILLKECKKNKLDTAVDTAGNVDFSLYQRIMPWTDRFLFDVKMADCEKHRMATGVENGRILSNLEKLLSSDVNIHIRIPVIPSFHDEQEIEIMAQLLREKGAQQAETIELLPYHEYGKRKYQQLSMKYSITDCPPDETRMKKYKEIMKKYGLVCRE